MPTEFRIFVVESRPVLIKNGADSVCVRNKNKDNIKMDGGRMGDFHPDIATL